MAVLGATHLQPFTKAETIIFILIQRPALSQPSGCTKRPKNKLGQDAISQKMLCWHKLFLITFPEYCDSVNI